MDENEQRETRQRVFRGLVGRMREKGLSGKLRDDASAHYLAGAVATGALGYEEDLPKTYLDVLEALA